MPAFIKTARDERLWAKAKAQAKKEYPWTEKDGDKFWKIVNGIYQKMSDKSGD
jgi:hypothetical protein